MARLIDANNLNFDGQHYNKSQMKAILDFLDHQPTAYDVDNVLCELDDILRDEISQAVADDVSFAVRKGGASE